MFFFLKKTMKGCFVYILEFMLTFDNQSTESTDGDGCIYACKSSNREIFSLIPFVQPAI